MMKFRLLSIVAVLVFLPALLSAQTSDPEPGQPIAGFEVEGNATVARDTIRVYLGIIPGDPYDPAALRENFLNLWQTGLFDDIKLTAEQTANGVLIRAIVKERPRVGAVEYRGYRNLTLAKINEALESAKINLHIGSTVDPNLVKRAAETIRRTYTEGGFEGVTVKTEFEPMGSGSDVRVLFHINEGIKARVADIRFEGNKRFSDTRLRHTMKEVQEHGPITAVRKKNLYVPSKLQEDLQRVKNLYQDHGYQDIQLGDPKIESISYVGRNWYFKRVPKERVKITIPVIEGPVHTFGGIEVEGNEVFTDEQLIGNLPLSEGEVLNLKPLRDRIDFFEELYRRRGYIYAFIDPVYEDVGNNTVQVKLNVYEGEQFRLGRLEFEGNTVTKDKVLRREIYVEEGDIMDMETFKLSMYKLGQLGYFKVTENPDFKVNPEDKTVDIVIKGREEGKNDVQFGGGYSEAYGFFAQFQFSTRNFLGEGETVGVAFQRGRSQNFFSLSYADPWFLDKPQSFGVSLFNRTTDLPRSVGFESRARGGSVAYGFRLDRFESISFLYGFEKREDHVEFVPPPDPEGNIPLPDVQDEKFTTSAFAPSYRFDSRDNPFDTFRGAKASLSLGYAGGPLGGDVNMLKPIGNFAWFKPLSRKTTFSFNVEGGQIFPLDDDGCAHLLADAAENRTKLCIPRSERFYTGGEQSIRGFRSHTIGPRESLPNSGSQLVGGYKYAVFNTEYVYKVNDPLRFVLWADAGNSYGYAEDWDLSDLRYSAGAELRIFLPVFQFPLRFIYARNLDPRPTDAFESFQFSVGNTF